MLRPRLLAVLLLAAAATLGLALPGAGAATPKKQAAAKAKPKADPFANRRVLLAFLPFDTRDAEEGTPKLTILDRLALHPQLSLGLMGATQGGYTQIQALLDMSQGTRVSAAAYHPKKPPEMAFFEEDGHALFQGWLEANHRAESAPADVVPGLLGASIPGGTAYAGVNGREQIEALPAANRAGRIDEVSLGQAEDVAERAMKLLRRKRFVVAGLPTNDAGDVAVDQLIAQRLPDELLLIAETPLPARAPQLLPTGVLGLSEEPGGLKSATTRLQGVVAGIDVAPTTLEWLGQKVPGKMKGEPIEVVGKRDAGALDALGKRLRVLGGRRFPALETVLAAWLLVLLVLAIVADRRGARAAMRLGALAVMWLLPMLLVTAALRPGRGVELLTIAFGSFALAALTEWYLPWPRGPALPCLVTVVAYVVDLARGSDLIIRSLLGPNPRFGSRYYGIGNELESSLPVLLFIGLAALLYGRTRSKAGAITFAAAGLFLGAAVGSGRLGADVGGVITIGAGTAVATLFMLPGGITRRSIILAAAVPFAALIALAALDIVTGGNSHFTRTVLRAEDKGALEDIFVRRYELAYNALKRGLMPFATAIAALTVVYGIKYRARLYAPLGDSPAWTAALAGSLAAGIAGSLSNDSGPLLLVVSTFAIVAATVYVRGDPRLAGEPAAAPPEEPLDDEEGGFEEPEIEMAILDPARGPEPVPVVPEDEDEGR